LAPFYDDIRPYPQLKRISPIEHHVDPVTAGTGSTIRGISAVDLIAKSEVVTGLEYCVIQITGVVPQDTRADAHPNKKLDAACRRNQYSTAKPFEKNHCKKAL
jgi:hypothetical protein